MLIPEMFLNPAVNSIIMGLGKIAVYALASLVAMYICCGIIGYSTLVVKGLFGRTGLHAFWSVILGTFSTWFICLGRPDFDIPVPIPIFLLLSVLMSAVIFLLLKHQHDKSLPVKSF